MADEKEKGAAEAKQKPAFNPDDVKCDCCEDGEVANAAGQRKELLARLQNPVRVQYVGLGPRQTWIGTVTNFEYYAGNKLTVICVDERDVPGLLNIRRGGHAIFRRIKGEGELVRRDDAPVPVTQDDKTPVEDRVAALSVLDGVGAKTAGALAAAGYSVESLAAMDESDVETVAKASDVSASIVRRAIESARASVAPEK